MMYYNYYNNYYNDNYYYNADTLLHLRMRVFQTRDFWMTSCYWYYYANYNYLLV